MNNSANPGLPLHKTWSSEITPSGNECTPTSISLLLALNVVAAVDSENLAIARCGFFYLMRQVNCSGLISRNIYRGAAEMLLVKSFIKEFVHTRIIPRRIEFSLRYKNPYDFTGTL